VSTIVKQEIAVGGMTCGGCVKSVTRVIAELPGVQKVDVSLEKKSATVEYDATAVDAAAIVAAIGGAGFEASPR
jgi:copper chaperone